ncbi:helix-turn-helix domain-containing protein [Actinomadura viridis]|uniref:helix-turn-helix domain-containing protein n=1 Tax=Actinomadura viridis TaxID=58110 RepID=UPI0036C6FA7D
MGARPGAVIRAARIAAGMTQQQLGHALHCSASTISRMETGTQSVDVPTRQRLAGILRIPPARLGITATVTTEPPGEDDVRRRELLTNLTLTAAAATAGLSVAPATAGTGSTSRIRDAMLGTGPLPSPTPPDRLTASLLAAIGDYDACRYTRLADTLPRLITSAHAAGVDRALAETYTLATRFLIKLADPLGLIAGDRARTYALGAGEPLLIGEAARNLAVLARREGWHSQAANIAMHAADGDALAGPDPARAAERGLLLMSAAYTAAHAGDRAGMRDLTAQAAAIARGLGDGVLLRRHSGGFSPTVVQLHLISAEYTAGDPSAALAAARRLSPQALPTLERRARYLTDIARAYGMWGRREETVRALLAAERVAPEETRARPSVRALVSGLLATGRTSPELRGLAVRCGLT